MLNLAPLHTQLKEKRLTLTLTDIAKQCGLSAATLSRSKPRLTTIVSLTNGLEIPFSSLFEPTTKNTLDVIEEVVLQDPYLTPEAAQAILTLFKAAYAQHTDNTQIH